MVFHIGQEILFFLLITLVVLIVAALYLALAYSGKVDAGFGSGIFIEIVILARKYGVHSPQTVW